LWPWSFGTPDAGPFTTIEAMPLWGGIKRLGLKTPSFAWMKRAGIGFLALFSELSGASLLEGFA
jgi:hypothetical protein